MKNGIFTISLDFELLWGIFDKVGTSYRSAYFANTRSTIPRMLDLFAENQIEVTWATVGMLFAENEEEWSSYSPEFLPTYRTRELSAYAWVRSHGLRPEVHFAPELIRQIIQTPGQELASHTFAHYYTLMRGQSPEQFRQDLQATQRIATDKFGLSLRSLVFPRNHINELYLPICLGEGFESVRGNPRNWFWQETQHESFGKKLFRSADCFFQVGHRSSYSLGSIKRYADEPWIIPASRILRPRGGGMGLMDRTRLRRIMAEMERAATQNEVYHLWWHPHNFGTYPQESMRELAQLIAHFKALNESYGFASLNMESVTQLLAAKQSALY